MEPRIQIPTGIAHATSYVLVLTGTAYTATYSDSYGDSCTNMY